MAKNHPPAAILLLLSLILSMLSSCDEQKGGVEAAWREKLRQDLQSTEARLDEVRDKLIQQQTKAREELEEVQRQLKGERARTESAESDFLIAAVICFSCVLTVFVLLNLLVKEHRNKKVLLRFFHWLNQRRGSNGKFRE